MIGTDNCIFDCQKLHFSIAKHKKTQVINEIQTNIDILKQFADEWHILTGSVN